MPDFRQKTIRVPANFTPVTDLTNNTLTLIGTPTIYIPENDNSTVTFKSVMLYCQWEDTAIAGGASGTRLVQFQADIQLQDAVSPSNVTINGGTAILVNLSENVGGIFGPIDFTEYFNTGIWESDQTTQTCETRILLYTDTGTSTDFRSVYVWYDITYEYPVDATTYIQTVCIPHESYSTYIPTTATQITTLSQLTGAGGILAGYNTPVVRHRWLEIKGADSSINATDFALRYSFDGGTLTDLETVEAAIITTRYHTYQIDITGLDNSTTHTLELASTLATRWGGVIINEWLSFEYIVSGTTRVLNYIEVPIELESFTAGLTAAFNSSFTRELLIPEKNITQLNCAAELSYQINASPVFMQTKIGSQASYRPYTGAGISSATPMVYQHRFDTGSNSGEGIALTSGLNTLSLFIYQSSAVVRAVSNVCGVIKILYLSDVSNSGLHNHTQTVKQFIRQPLFLNLNYTTLAARCISSTAFLIPNTDYYIQTAGLQYTIFHIWGLGSIQVKARLLAGEGAGEGYRELYTDSVVSQAELAYTTLYVRARDEFKRYPEDLDTTRMDIQVTRDIELATTQNTKAVGTTWNVAYHGITHSVSGSVTGSSGASSTLQLFQVVDGEYNLYKTGSVTGDSPFEFSVYDDTTPYIVSAYSNSSLKGISKLATPTTGFDIDYAGGGGGGGAGGEFFF